MPSDILDGVWLATAARDLLSSELYARSMAHIAYGIVLQTPPQLQRVIQIADDAPERIYGSGTVESWGFAGRHGISFKNDPESEFDRQSNWAAIRARGIKSYKATELRCEIVASMDRSDILPFRLVYTNDRRRFSIILALLILVQERSLTKTRR